MHREQNPRGGFAYDVMQHGAICLCNSCVCLCKLLHARLAAYSCSNKHITGLNLAIYAWNWNKEGGGFIQFEISNGTVNSILPTCRDQILPRLSAKTCITYIYIYIYTCLCICTYIYIYIYIYISISISLSLSIYIYIHIYTDVYPAAPLRQRPRSRSRSRSLPGRQP